MQIKQLARIAALIACVFSFFAPGISLTEERPRIELILMLDWSRSMYSNQAVGDKPWRYRWHVQRDGHMNALRSDEVRRLLIVNRVHVRVVLWSEKLEDIRQIFSSQIHSDEDISRLTTALAAGVPSSSAPHPGTQHATILEWVQKSDPVGRRRILDISTDEAPSVSATGISGWKALLSSQDSKVGTTINVLAVEVSASELGRLDVLRTSDGFVMQVSSWTDYAEALQSKLILELAMAAQPID